MNAADWLQRRRQLYAPHVTQIAWRDCDAWSFRGGKLAHETGAYFSIVGVTARSNEPALDGLAIPMIDQPEIGILAFLLREGGDGYDWLLQAKAEPGTVQGVQAAPSVQATESNYKRVHGGAPTTYLPLVLDEGDCPGRLVDVRQSEQGSMFLNKYNRNVATLTSDRLDVGDQWRWTASAELRELLLVDYAINTDARSVIATTPWRYVSQNGTPFSAQRDAWRVALAESYAAPSRSDEALERLKAARAAITLESARTSLNALRNCVRSEDEIVSSVRTPILRIRPYAVEAPDREVPAWRQPLVLRDDAQAADLICARREGALMFYFALSPEIGFANKVQLGPSAQSDAFVTPPAWITAALADSRSIERCSVLQSDEGGRFMHCITRYRVCEIPQAAARDDEHGVWITLGDIERLAQKPGVLTNEARTLVSLLLRWA